MKLHKKILGIVIPIVVFLTSALIYISLDFLESKMNAEQKEYNNNLLSQMDSVANEHIDDTKRDLVLLAKGLSLSEISSINEIDKIKTAKMRIAEQISLLETSKDSINNLYYVGADNSILFSINEQKDSEKEKEWISSLLHMITLKKNEFKIGVSRFNEASNVYYIVPITTNRQSEEIKKGFLILTESLSSLSERLQNRFNLNNGFVIIGDRTDILFNHSPIPDSLLIKTKKTGSVEDLVETTKGGYFYVRHPFCDDVYFASIYPSLDFNNKIKVLRWIVLGTIISMSLMFLMIIFWIIDKTIGKPLKDIRAVAESINNENLDDETKTELANIAEILTGMVLKNNKKRQRIIELSSKDDLTGLNNRMEFHKKIEILIQKSTTEENKFALYSIDIDNFAEINELFGHSVADEILKEFVNQIKLALHDVVELCSAKNESLSFLAGRTGSDEFMIALYFIKDRVQAEFIAKFLLERLSRALLVGGHLFKVDFTMGIVISPENGNDSKSLFRHVKMVLNEAKMINRTQYSFYDESVSERFFEKKELKADIQMALLLNQFYLYFQPKVSLHDDSVSQFEALIRWEHPTKGNITPEQFIPFAERESLIMDIGEWVMMSVCHHISIMENTGWDDFSVSFNVSPQQIQDLMFIKKLSKCIDENDIDPRHLEIEITESSLARDPYQVEKTIEAVRAMGIKVALDDFGIGYSSLSHLELLSIDVLKVDRTFIERAGRNQSSMTIINAIIAIAKSLNLQCVAEGVETEQELSIVKEKGFDVVQGFFFYKPMSFQDIQQFLNKK
jgi:diguanylate cyclase (GGDEF) domain